MKKNTFIIITLLFQFVLFANEKQNKTKARFLRMKYEVKEVTNLQSIYESVLFDNVTYSDQFKMVRVTKKYNDHIKDWNSLSPQTISLYVDTSKVDINKLIKDQKLSTGQENILRKKSEPVVNRDKRLKTSVFYMASTGSFDQSKNGAKALFNQNSSFSIGASASYKLKMENLSLASSFYYSYLDTTSSNLDFGDVKVDAEIGANFYGNYEVKEDIKIYTGLDFERFNSFNMDRLVSNSEISFDKNNIFYLTLGIQKDFVIYKKKVLTKLSFSHSAISSQSSVTEGEEFTGSKFMVYAATNVYKKLFVHALYKYHKMSGSSDLDASRFGLGFGYSF